MFRGRFQGSYGTETWGAVRKHSGGQLDGMGCGCAWPSGSFCSNAAQVGLTIRRIALNCGLSVMGAFHLLNLVFEDWWFQWLGCGHGWNILLQDHWKYCLEGGVRAEAMASGPLWLDIYSYWCWIIKFALGAYLSVCKDGVFFTLGFVPFREKRSLNTISFDSAMGLIRNTLNLGVQLSEVSSPSSQDVG